MRSPAFVALVVPASSSDASVVAEALTRRLEADSMDLKPRGSTGRCRLWAPEDTSVHVLPDAAGFVIGDLFSTDAGGVDEVRACTRSPDRMARALCEAHWGRYVALLHGPPPTETAAFRDPSGQLGCLTWSHDGGIEVVASDLRVVPAWLRPKRLTLNWDRIAEYLAVPGAVSHRPLFDGVDAIAPGELASVGGDLRHRNLVWRPADAVSASGASGAEAAAELVRRVDDCTATLVKAHSRVLLELSGGLDSAIVAGALDATGFAPRVVQWLNRVGDRPGGDERAYARAVTDRLGVELTTTTKPLTPLTQDGIMELAAATWPAINGCDAERDRDEVARLVATGASAILSGQGGDIAFYQMPTSKIVADEWRRQGPRLLTSPVLADIARRTRQSVWSVLAEVAADARGREPPDLPPSLVSQDVLEHAGSLSHPWVEDARARGVPPGKRLQIEALAGAQLLHGDTRRGAVAQLLYPLLAQPVIEWCLSIPTGVLAGGAFDRLFAREAFACRIPELIRNRRSKGDLTSYFARLVAGSLDTLRPFLLEGCLCEAGVLDRQKLEQALDPNQLIWRAGGTQLMWAATVEGWVRYWQGRIPDSARAPRFSA